VQFRPSPQIFSGTPSELHCIVELMATFAEVNWALKRSPMRTGLKNVGREGRTGKMADSSRLAPD
jgi:hypothetical protein